jgi:hypothetical protein
MNGKAMNGYVYVVTCTNNSHPTEVMRDTVVVGVATTQKAAVQIAIELFKRDLSWSYEYWHGFECWHAKPNPRPELDVWILLRRVVQADQDGAT